MSEELEKVMNIGIISLDVTKPSTGFGTTDSSYKMNQLGYLTSNLRKEHLKTDKPHEKDYISNIR